MPIFVFWGPKPQIWIFGPRPPMFQKMLELVIVFEQSHWYASKEPSAIFQSICKIDLCIFSCFGGQSPKYGNLAPGLQILIKQNIFFGLDNFVSLTCFQQALNHYLEIILRQYMTSSIICQTGQTSLLDFSRLGDKSGRIQSWPWFKYIQEFECVAALVGLNIRMSYVESRGVTCIHSNCPDMIGTVPICPDISTGANNRETIGYCIENNRRTMECQNVPI